MTTPSEGKQKKVLMLVLPVVLAFFAATPFWAAAQTGSDDEVTLANLEERVESAKTAQDHQAIAAFYRHQSEEAQASASKHETMAQMYKRNTSKVVRSSGAMVEHCDKLAAGYRALADELLALAKDHDSMASAHLEDH